MRTYIAIPLLTVGAFFAAALPSLVELNQRSGSAALYVGLLWLVSLVGILRRSPMPFAAFGLSMATLVLSGVAGKYVSAREGWPLARGRLTIVLGVMVGLALLTQLVAWRTRKPCDVAT